MDNVVLDLRLVDQILEVSPYACALITKEFGLVYMNSIMRQDLSHKNGEELLHKPINQFICKEDRKAFIHFVNHSDGFDARDGKLNLNIFWIQANYLLA